MELPSTDDHEACLEFALNQDGGGRHVQYGELHAVLSNNDIMKALDYLKNKTQNREYFMHSVNRALKKGYKGIINQTASKKKADNFAADLSIWFANEIIEGRQPLEEIRN